MTTLDKIKEKFHWVWSVRSEITAVAVVLLLFSNLAGWLRAIDPTAATFDVGLLMAPAIGVVALFVGVLCFWIVWRFGLGKKQDQWFDGDVKKTADGEPNLPTFDGDWNSATPDTRLNYHSRIFLGVLLVISAFALVFS
jgi:hypothetical protein|tara:strand:+ start:1856 stop:2272 length:417 start_codon:yes stop_codon:yes gene_type:complete